MPSEEEPLSSAPPFGVASLPQNQIKPDYGNYIAEEQKHKHELEKIGLRHKNSIDSGLVIFGAAALCAIGVFAGSIILNPKSPNELTKLAFGVIGAATGACAGLIRRS